MPGKVENKYVLHWLSNEELLKLETSKELEILTWELKLEMTEKEIKTLKEEISTLDQEKSIVPLDYKKIKENRILEINEKIKDIEKQKQDLNKEFKKKLTDFNRIKQSHQNERTLIRSEDSQVHKGDVDGNILFSKWNQKRQVRIQWYEDFYEEHQIKKYYQSNNEMLKLALHDLCAELLNLKNNNLSLSMEMKEKEISKEERYIKTKLRQLDELIETTNKIKKKISDLNHDNHKIKEELDTRKNNNSTIDDNKPEPLIHQLGIIKP